ncbi:MAG: hypothetical protein JOY54_07380 [Acidobacteriaceae bacterium]|nr:hypothetical protein [Acidobacteriaceae bacterium]
MCFLSRLRLAWCFAPALCITPVLAWTQQFDIGLFSKMQWRLIGPFRAGRVTAVAGVSGDPNVYYFGTPGGGIWKTVDAGRVWKPVFDAMHVASIGALTVAPSDPNVVYAGTGEQTPGNGMYRSNDAGVTWANIGLRGTRNIQAVIVDPHNPETVVVGANSVGFQIIWQPYPKSALTIDRGIYKTTDGGKTWKKVLTKDDTFGVVDMCADPSNPRVLYAALFRPPFGSGKSAVPATSELYKSTDEGSTWKPLETRGLPETGRGRVGIAVAPGNRGRRLYAIMDQGFFRSDDSGASWQKSTQDPRILGSPYFSRIFPDPRNPDILYVAQTSLYRSTDGGHTFESYVGAPSGDDFHVLWIDPQNPARMLLGVDQGAIVSVNAGRTWTSWYNQPTGQFYHVSTGNAFPYRVYAAQQDSGTAAVPSRSDYGQITARDWYSIAGFEYCYIVADPLNPNFVYSGGWYGSVVKFDKVTGQFATVFERGDKYRTAQMAPLIFSPQDPHTLYLGTQYVLKTANGGRSWKPISPDLTGYVEKPGQEEEAANAEPAPAITTLSPSMVQAGEIWAGTSNRKVQVTRDDGSSWQDVSPPALPEPNQILTVEAGHHDPATAYITAGGHRQFTPAYVARTHDYGHTWQKIVNGLPEQDRVRVVREDPVREGLLYAGTDTGVYVSFDDGDHWQSLQLNLPAATVTDLDVHGNDLVASTFGRALWILDDLTPLREMSRDITESGVHLFSPEVAVRVRWDNDQDTPYPPETPAGQNPPDGAILDYFLKSPPSGEIGMTIYDANGNVVRHYSSQSKAPKLPPPNVPDYWFAPPEVLSKSAGVNRFVWDLRYPSPPSLPYSYNGGLLEYTEYTLADHAIPGNTPAQQPQGPLVVPGSYTFELTVDGRSYRQPITVKLDPRVNVSEADLQQQLALAKQVASGMSASYVAYQQAGKLAQALTELKKRFTDEPRWDPVRKEANAIVKKLEDLQNGPKSQPGFGPINRDLARLASAIESADAEPAETARAAVNERCKALNDDLVKWRQLNAELSSLNAMLSMQKLTPMTVVTVSDEGCSGQFPNP